MNNLSYSERKEKVISQFGEFPIILVFYLCRELDGKYGISFFRTTKKIEIENYKLESLKMLSFSGASYTPLEVKVINNFDELEEKLNNLSEEWVEERDEE